MNRKNVLLCLAVAALLAGGGQALARRVTHPVTPKNIDQQPFAFTVQVKDVEQLKEVTITVRQKPGKPAPIITANGWVGISPRDNTKVTSPAITRVLDNGVQTYSFRVTPADLDRATFTFTETAEDWRTPFPYPGDYWIFDLRNFVGSPRK
jgi:hypothetical protein